MTTIIDAFGKACPMPLMMAKKELDAGCRDLAIQVDNETAVKNVSRLGQKTGMSVSVEQIEGGWLVSLSGAGAGAGAGVATEDAPVASGSAAESAGEPTGGSPASSNPAGCSPTGCGPAGCGPAGCGYAVFVGKDHVGEGDPQLGYNLMKMAIYTLSESDAVPASLLFMNSGVKLVAGEGERVQQVVESVRKLAERGCEVLVCGTCLDFYGLKQDLQVGEVSNMYDILGRMQEAAKVITL